MYRLRAKRTLGLNPPAELLFGELAYSDANKRLYVGRADGSPATFESDLSLAPITDSIAVLNVAGAVQSSAIADLTNDLATLDTNQAAQGQAIALLSAASDSQGDAIGQLATTTSTQGNALATLATETQAALETKLEAAAIADLETTSKLNDRDTANRDRANHTGTQPAATVEGLAPVATSGAYADLEGNPAIPLGALNYDQTAEPSSPSVGQVWRERTAGGLIVREWEWLGSVWAAVNATIASLGLSGSGVTTYPSLHFEAPKCLFVECRISVFTFSNPVSPFDASNYRELFLGRATGAPGAAIFTFRPLINRANGDAQSIASYVASMNYLSPTPATFFTGTNIVGTPGSMGNPGVSYVYRRVR